MLPSYLRGCRNLAVAVTLASAPAFAEGPCDAVLGAAASEIALEDRAKEVQGCYSTATPAVRAWWENAFIGCRTATLASEQPTTVELPEATPIVPSAEAASWEAFAAELGDGAILSGCRDGIRSALHQIAYLTQPVIHDLFVNTALRAEDLLLGDHGQFIVDDTTFTGGFSDVQATPTELRDLTQFHSAPLEMDSKWVVRARVGPFLQRLEFDARFKGIATGTLDSVGLRVDVTEFEVTSIEVTSATPLKAQIEDALKQGFAENKPVLLENTTDQMTAALWGAYENANPFGFIR